MRGGMAFADRLGGGRSWCPLRPLLIPANRMVKPKTREYGDRSPLGAKMRSSAFHTREKYCHSGAWPSPTTTASAWPGVHDGDHGPFRRSPENSLFAGKQAAGSGGPCAFGDRNGLVWLSHAREVLPQRGMAFAHHHGV